MLMLMGGRAVGLACPGPGARTPIGVSGIFLGRVPEGSPTSIAGFFLCAMCDVTKIASYR